MRADFFLPPPCFDLAAVDDGSGEAHAVPLRMDLSDGDAPDVGENSDEHLAADFTSTLAKEQAAFDRLRDVKSSDLQVLVNEVNACLRKFGYQNLHQKEERDLAAYYMCGCREKGCFLVTFCSAPQV